MKLLKLFSVVASFMLLVTCIATPSSAFMVDEKDSAAESPSVAAGLVSELEAEVAAGKTECADLLNKFNDAIDVIDAQLDAGVADEASYLAARERIVQMRLDLPCMDTKLTAMPGEGFIDGGMPIGDGSGQIVSDGMAVDGSMVSGSFGGGTGGFSQGGFSGSGGASGSSGGVGGGGIGLLAAGGIAAAIAIPIATSDDEPGDVASPSTDD